MAVRVKTKIPDVIYIPGKKTWIGSKQFTYPFDLQSTMSPTYLKSPRVIFHIKSRVSRSYLQVELIPFWSPKTNK